MSRNIATEAGAEAIYLFIAELNGYKTGTEADKLIYGKQCYLDSKYHNPDTNTEAGRKEFHEDIWLERLYNQLDSYTGLNSFSKKRATVDSIAGNCTHKWEVPIELDAGALA